MVRSRVGAVEPGQIAKWIQSYFLGCLNQAIDHRAVLGAQWGVGKQKDLSPNHKGFDAALGSVVAQLSPSSRYRKR